MSRCPSPQAMKTDAWKLLVEEVGEQKAISIWKANGYAVPEKEKISVWTEKYKTQEGVSSELSKKADIEAIYNKLKNPGVTKDNEKQVYINEKTGEVVSQRVSDLKNAYARQQGTDYRGEPDDFAAKKGTIIHRYLEEIGKAQAEGRDYDQKRITEEVMKLRNLPDFAEDTEQFFRLEPAQYKLLNKGMKHLMASIEEIQKKTIDPEGEVKFFFETSVIDEARDLAGTVDMIAVFSDGSAGVYDFKSYSRTGRRAPGQTVIDHWDIQLSNYKNMLKRNYGVTKFRQSRAIPIQTSYTKKEGGKYINQVYKGFQSIGMQNNDNAENLEHLDPIPLSELTGDENLDELVESLLKEKKQTEFLYRQANPKDQARILSKLSRINNSLKNIQLNRDIVGTMNDLTTLYKKYEERLRKGPSEDGYMNEQELSDAIGEMQIYANIANNYKNQLQHLSKEKRGKVKGQLKTTQVRINSLIDDLLAEVVERVGSDVTKPGEHVKFFTRNFAGLENWNIPIFQKLYDLVTLADEMKRRDTKEEFKAFDKVAEPFTEWANANGYSGHKKFELLYNRERGELYDKYSKEFWKKRYEITRKARSKKDNPTKAERQWLRDNFKFDTERFKQERKLQFEVIDADVEYGNISEEEADRRKEQWHQTNSLKANENNFFTARADFLIPKEDAGQDYITEEWKFIQANEPLKNFYDMLKDYNQQWTEEFGGQLIGRNFVPNVKAGMMKQVLENGPGGNANMLEALKRQHHIHQQDSIAGVRDNNGNKLASVPLLYTDPLRRSLTEREESEIRQMVADDVAVTHERGSEEFEQEVQRRIREREKELGIQAQSTDLIQSFKAMIYSANNHRHTSAIEGQVKLLQALMQHDKVAQNEITEKDQTYIDKFTNNLSKKMGVDPTYKEAFEEFVQMFVYGRSMKNDKVIAEKYSMNKVGQSFMNFLSVRALGLNHTIQISDFIQGKTGLWLKAKEGMYFDKTGIKAAFDLYGKRDDQFRNAVEFFEPASRNLRTEEIELSGATLLSRRLTQRSLFIGYEWADDNINNLILVGMAKKYVFDSDGKIKNPEFDEILDENAPTVFDAVQKKDDDTVYMEGLTIEEFNKFRRKVLKQANLIKGTTTEFQKGLITRTLLGQAVMQFKSWMPGLAEARFSSLKYDQTMESFEMGRFNAGFSELLGNGFKGALTQFLKIGSEVVTMGLYKKEINQAAVDRQYAKYMENHPNMSPNEFTKEAFIKMKTGKLRSFVAELRVYLALVLTVQMLSKMDWDDEEEGTIFTWEAQTIARRALLEASFWWNPQSVNEIVRRPIALMGLAESMVDIIDNSLTEANYALRDIDNPRDETPFGYYILKNTPGITQVLDMTGFLHQYNPPKSAFDRIFSSNEEIDGK